VLWEPINCNCCGEATSVQKKSIQMEHNLANHFFEVDHFTESQEGALKFMNDVVAAAEPDEVYKEMLKDAIEDHPFYIIRSP